MPVTACPTGVRLNLMRNTDGLEIGRGRRRDADIARLAPSRKYMGTVKPIIAQFCKDLLTAFSHVFLST